MYKHILIPTDGSPLSEKAVSDGIALAKETTGKVTVLTVTLPFHIFSLDPAMVEYPRPKYDEVTKAHAEKTLANVADAARMAGVECQTLRVEHEHPYEAIIDTARSRGCDLIVMASHGRRGIGAMMLGSETAKVLTHSKIPVLVHR
jgi:nucleotide-binding universal stress UspA family protein